MAACGKVRKHIKTTRILDYAKCSALLREQRQHFASYLRPPAQIDPTYLNRIAGQIVAYYTRITQSGFPHILTVKKASIFTAMIAARLTAGFAVGGVTVIQKHPLFDQHGIAEVQYAKLSTETNNCKLVLKCNDMTVMYKTLRRACHNQGIVSHPYIFKLDAA